MNLTHQERVRRIAIQVDDDFREHLEAAADRLDALEAALKEIGPAIDASAHWIDMRGRVDLIIEKALGGGS